VSGILGVSADIAVSGMRAQAERLKIVSENIANADSLSTRPGGDPYRRQVVTFKEHIDRDTGAKKVRVDRVLKDRSDFIKKYMPGHPSANADGYVNTPNVNTLIELMDLKEAQRSYEANMNVMKASRGMGSRALDLLK
jgi:flagellar basal-body rod protein FlgC